MRNQKHLLFVALGILCGFLAAPVILDCSNYGAYAEALPSPDAAALLALSGDLRLSEAPMDIYVAECLRVDVVPSGPAGHLTFGERQGAWADLTLQYAPPVILSVALFDGWHLVYGAWEQIGETTLRLRFLPDELSRLDGTVGIYLVILADK